MLVTMGRKEAELRLWAAYIRDGELPGDRDLAGILCQLLDSPHRKLLEGTARRVVRLLRERGAPPPGSG